MNSTVFNSSASKYLSIYLSEIMGYYLIPVTAFFGFLANLFLCDLIYKLSKFKKRFYNIIFSKNVTQAIACFIGISWQNAACTNCIESFEISNFFKFFILTNIITVLYFVDCFLDILISYDRYCLLVNKKPLIEKIHFLYIYLFIVTFSILLCSPRFFILPKSDRYLLEMSSEIRYSHLVVLSTILISILSIVALISVTIKVTGALIKTKQLRNNHKVFLYELEFKKSYKAKHRKKKRTKSIIYLFTFFLNIRVFYFIIILPFESDSIDKYFREPVLDVLKSTVHWYLFINFALTIFVYLSSDRVLRKILHSTLKTLCKRLRFF